MSKAIEELRLPIPHADNVAGITAYRDFIVVVTQRGSIYRIMFDYETDSLRYWQDA